MDRDDKRYVNVKFVGGDNTREEGEGRWDWLTYAAL